MSDPVPPPGPLEVWFRLLPEHVVLDDDGLRCVSCGAVFRVVRGSVAASTLAFGALHAHGHGEDGLGALGLRRAAAAC